MFRALLSLKFANESDLHVGALYGLLRRIHGAWGVAFFLLGVLGFGI